MYKIREDSFKKQLLLIGSLILILIALLWGISLLFNSSDNKDVVKDLYFDNISSTKEVGRLNTINKVDKNIYYKVDYPSIGNEKIDNEIKSQIDGKINDVKKEYVKDQDKVDCYYIVDYETYIGPGNTLSVVLKERVESDNLEVLNENTYSFIFDLEKQNIMSKEEIFKDGYLEFLKKYVEDINDNFNFIINDNKLILIDYNKEIELSLMKDYLKVNLDIEDSHSSEVVEVKYTVLNKEYQAKIDFVLYEKATNDSEIVEKVKKDEIVKVYQQGDNGWCSILYNGKILFVRTENLKEVEKVDEPVINDDDKGNSNNDTKPVTMYVIVDVNVREQPTTASEILGELKIGEEVTKIGTVGNFTKIKYKDGEAYVSSNCVSKQKIVHKEVKVDVPPQSNIDPKKPMVALSFDDGPSPKATVRILDTLEKYNVRATFFDVGNLMVRYPEVVKREAKLGEVGTHSWSHKKLTTLTEAQLKEDLDKCRKAQKDILGYEPVLMRPPYGSVNTTMKANIDMAIINWNVDSLDWKYRNADLTLHEIDKYGNLDGKIILMHSIHKETADAVEILVPDLLDRGYQIVTVSELATYKGYTLKTGTVYNGFK